MTNTGSNLASVWLFIVLRYQKGSIPDILLGPIGPMGLAEGERERDNVGNRHRQ